MTMDRLERRAIRQAAHKAVAQAIAHRVIDRPAVFKCMDCSRDAVEYDHRDYTKPLAVDPVCRRCNLARGPALVWTTDGRLPVTRKGGRCNFSSAHAAPAVETARV